MSAPRSRRKGRRERGTFLLLPHDVLDHANFAGLSHRATRLLIDVARQYNGSNNGDLTAAWKTMSARGWTSKDQLAKALEELLAKGWLVLTRQGRRPNIASLYAVTWWPVHECDGKLDRSATRDALGYWKTGANPEHSRKRDRDPRPAGNRPPPHGGRCRASATVVPLRAGHRAPKTPDSTPATRGPSNIYHTPYGEPV